MKNKDEIFEKLKTIMSDKMGFDGENATLESHIVNDLKMDSLDKVELIMEAEIVFDIQIDDDKLDGIETVGNMVNYIYSVSE